MDAPTATRDVASPRAGGRSELPRDAEVFGLGLEDDGYLCGAKLVAGALSALALIAMLITSLFRAPNSAWTVVLGVVAAGLIAVMSVQVVHRRGDR